MSSSFLKSSLLQFLLFTSIIVNSQVISEELVKKHIYTLASDEMEGRKAGTKGIEKAAQYIEKEFERIGLDNFDEMTSFRQTFEKNGLSLFNLIGFLEGKSKKNEFIIISAHYDHLGIKTDGEGDLIFNGANDNASGVAAVLSIAEYYTKDFVTERSILFIAFTAEEMGLVGSNYFGNQINPDKIVTEEEHKTARLERRLLAARKVSDAGFKLAFHFDPIFHYPGSEKAYRDLVKRLFSIIDKKKIM